MATGAAAQDAIFSQFYAMPLQLNPGFAGSAFAPRAGLAYRNQWTGFNNAYRSYGAYYEQSLARLNSGIGFNIEGDNAGDGIWKTTQVSIVYAYRIHISDATAIRIGVEGGARQNNLAWDKLIFPDQIDEINGIGINTQEIRPDITNRINLDIGAGLLLLDEYFYLGGSMKHLNSPKEGIILINDNLSRGLPVRYMLHGGASINVKEGNKRRAGSFISPNFLFAAQGPYKQLNVGAYAGLGPVICGAWFRHTFRNADAAILMAGFRQGVFKMGLSYDLTVSELAGRSGGTFELSLGVMFDKDEVLRKKKRRADLNNCLRMFQ